MHEEAEARDIVSADTRYTFTGQFLCFSAYAPAVLRRSSATTESPDDATRTEHLGLVIIGHHGQCAAAVETQAAELLIHGPGSHLGSDGVDKKARDFLAPLAGIRR